MSEQYVSKNVTSTIFLAKKKDTLSFLPQVIKFLQQQVLWKRQNI